MIKRLFYAFAACGMAAGLVGLSLVASPVLDDVLGRYPGSVLIASGNIDCHTLGSGTLRRQATYQTLDTVTVVKQWYAAHLHISPASDLYVTGGDGCAWLNQSNAFFRFQQTVSVLLCPVSGGTRVVVNESVEVGR